ncbi:DML1 [[Candida] subhashii]|uniref:Protein DML1 n=1 Tax=[Candida] subhashii TaxID=561895 RepID=A0A8J5QST7_9ASCO|nr:DML1 [[Candida] subhashii]KAG7665738.1 DML1 [[Candida] subhashii]
MGEVINISLSQLAGHTTTHLYNDQESLIPYTANAPITHNLTTFLSRFKSTSGTGSNFSPRSLVYDLRGGFGALNKYEYHESLPSFDEIPQALRISENKIRKSEYQSNLDAGLIDGSKLTCENTRYWTDYNKLIYNPKSLTTLNNFNYVSDEPVGSHFHFPNLKFATFNIGQKEFNEDDVDSFRNFLEQCDLFNGLQLTTEIDSAWGGYANEMLIYLNDEYFNTSKINIWTYGLMNSSNSATSKISRVKTIVELSKSSSLLFPIDVDYSSGMLSSIFKKDSLWHRSGLPAMFINSIWGVNSQLEGGESMSHVQANLLRGFEDRNIVNEIKIVSEESKNSKSMGIMDVDLTAYYTTGKLPVSKPSESVLNMGVSRDYKTYMSKNYIVGSNKKIEDIASTTTIYQNRSIDNILNIETFPTEILSHGKNTSYCTEFNIHEGLKDNLKASRKIIKNISLTNQPFIDIIEDKGELVEDLSRIIEEYTTGYDPDSEESDDDY